MSLRDQLLKAGLASKKDAARVEREKNQERRQQQAHRRPEAELRAEAEAERQRQLEAERQARVEARRAHEAEQAAVERRNRVKNLIDGNRMGFRRGRVPFVHKRVDGRRLHRLFVDDRTAWELRAGEKAIVCRESDETYHLFPVEAARRLAAIAPELVVFLVEDTKGISAKDEAFLRPDWESSLLPHRKA